MLIELFITVGAIWAMGFFSFQLVRLIKGRRTF